MNTLNKNSKSGECEYHDFIRITKLHTGASVWDLRWPVPELIGNFASLAIARKIARDKLNEQRIKDL